MGDHVLAGRAESSREGLTGHAQGQPWAQVSSVLMGEHLGLPYPLFWDCRLEPTMNPRALLTSVLLSQCLFSIANSS